MTRAVLDANVFISAAINPTGAPARCLRAHSEGRFALVASPLLLDELRRALRRERLRRYVTMDADLLVDALERDAEVVDDPVERDPVARDEGDDYLIALARSANAHVLVTGDRHLLELDLADLKIVSPREFLDLLPAQGGPRA